MMYRAGRDLAGGATELIGETAEALFKLGENVSGKIADVTKENQERGE